MSHTIVPAHSELKTDFQTRDRLLKLGLTGQDLPLLIDHTLLKPEATAESYQKLCREAITHGFRAVCVPPARVGLVEKVIRDHGGWKPAVCTVVGFANGYSHTQTKVFETKQAVSDGAVEIDFVQNVGWVKEGHWTALEEEYKAIVEAAHGRLVKIILETSLLTPEEIRECTRKAALSGVHTIKTSTGFGSRGASLADLEAIQHGLAEVERFRGVRCGIKASGGIRNLEDALAMVQAGATRLGTSGGVAMVQGQTHTTGY